MFLIYFIILLLNASRTVCKWQLIWFDNFNYTNIDRDKWFVQQRTKGEDCFLSSAVDVNNGTLIFRAVKNGHLKQSINDNIENCPIHSSGIYSIQAWTYGRFEIRATFQSNTGDSQILLRPQQYKYGFSSSDGIVIFYENNKKSGFGYSYGDKALNLFHLNYTMHHTIHNGFHIFVVEWDKSGIKFLINDHLYHYFKFNAKLYRSDELGTYEEVGQPFDHNFNIYFQSFPTPTTISNQIYSQIDYVKVYKWLETVSNHNESKLSINHMLLLFTIILSIVSIALFCSFAILLMYYCLKLSKLLKRNRAHMKEYDTNGFELAI